MPERSQSPDRHAVWMIWSRKLVYSLEFWLTVIGYNRKTHSFDSRIYLVYICIFFSLWIFAVLVLLADFTGQVLGMLSFGSPLSTAVTLAGLALTAFFLLELYSASRRSPFVFSESDSTLLCMTPVDRRYVALLWTLGKWAAQGLFLWAGAIVLGYGHLEAQSPVELGTADLPRYLGAGLSMLAVVVPLHLAMLSMAWSVGTWRLHGSRRLPALRWTAPLLAIVVLTAWFYARPGSAAGFPAWTWEIAFPLRAGLGAASLPAGIGLALLLAAVGLFLLWSAAGKMSLSRAAQETRGQEVLQTAIVLGATDLVREIRQRQRLGAGKKPARLPASPGPAALVWKNLVQGSRPVSLEQILTWLALPAMTLFAFQVSDWGTRGWLVLMWIVVVGGICVSPLRRDLRHWWLLHQLPFSSEVLVRLDLRLPLIGVVVTGLAALVIASWLRVPVPWMAVWLFLPGVVGIALAAAVDVLKQCRTERLLAGSAPDRSLRSVLLGALVVGFPASLGWWLLAAISWPLPLVIMAMLAVSALLDYGLYRWAGRLMRNIK